MSPVVLPPSVAHTWRQRVLVLPGWPHGVCPLHIYPMRKCDYTCVPARVAFAEAARELAAYFDGSHDRERAAA